MSDEACETCDKGMKISEYDVSCRANPPSVFCFVRMGEVVYETAFPTLPRSAWCSRYMATSVDVSAPRSESWGSWTPWDGCACPVRPETTIDVIYRDGRSGFYLKAGELAPWWETTGKPEDIVFYRPHSEVKP